LNTILRLAWERWKILGQINGDYLARFFVNLFYITVLVPFALIAQLTTDPLGLRKSANVVWRARKAVGASLEDARSQF
jgi:hypothetical protein